MTRPTLSTRQASRRTADAADQLLGWLQQQNGLPNRSGDAGAPSPVSPPLSVSEDAGQGLAEAAGPERDVGRSPTRCAGRTPNELPCPPKRFAVAAGVADDAARAAAPLRPPHTDWLHHRLLVTGPAGTLAEFQAAAGGFGTIPWRLDFDRMEEDLFLMLAAPPPPQRRRLSLVGARALAGQLRDAAERRHGAAVARVGQSRACALDLHALVPVPDSVLRLGPDHPDAFAWLWTHWGTTVALRHVVAEPVLPRRAAPGDPVTLRLAFWSADWTPWQALATVAARWPALRFDIRPTYGLL